MKFQLLAVITCLAFALTGCKKNQLGGKSVINGKVFHHTRMIPNATVYIKFNAREFPGTDSSLYDAEVKANANGEFSIACYKGEYYLYATGIDPQIQPLYVRGGVPVSIRQRETVEADVAVTEKH
jgi:hypothetical protein